MLDRMILDRFLCGFVEEYPDFKDRIRETFEECFSCKHSLKEVVKNGEEYCVACVDRITNLLEIMAKREFEREVK